MKKPIIYLNERCLKLRELHVIDENGQSIGVMSAKVALDIAKNRDLDLFVVSLNASPPIAKILN